MTLAVDLEGKATNKQNKTNYISHWSSGNLMGMLKFRDKYGKK